MKIKSPAVNQRPRREQMISNLVHGHSSDHYGKTATYHSWQAMKDRCYRIGNASYAVYGGRGITVCERWLHDFTAFLSDMGERPPGTSLDRIDGKGNYEPSNCRWATYAEQAANSTGPKWITFRGETRSQVGWSEYLGLGRHLVGKRIRYGWTVERALTAPVQKKKGRQ